MLRCAPLPDGRHVESGGIGRAAFGVGAVVLSPLPDGSTNRREDCVPTLNAAHAMPLSSTWHPEESAPTCRCAPCPPNFFFSLEPHVVPCSPIVTSPRTLEPPAQAVMCLRPLLESARSCLLRGEVSEERTPNRRENEEIGLTGFLFGSTNRNADLLSWVDGFFYYRII